MKKPLPTKLSGITLTTLPIMTTMTTIISLAALMIMLSTNVSAMTIQSISAMTTNSPQTIMGSEMISRITLQGS